MNPPAEPATEESAAPLDAELTHARAQLQASLVALQSRMEQWRDWRAWIRWHPLPFLVGAFAAGVLLGLRRGSRSER
jgi:hypothetical protein